MMVNSDSDSDSDSDYDSDSYSGSILIRTMSCFRLGGGSEGCVNNQAGGEVQGGAGDCV